MGKSTISMAMFNSYVSLPEGKYCDFGLLSYTAIVVQSRVPNIWRNIPAVLQMTSLDFSIAKEIPMDISRFASISLEKIDAIYFIITIHIISPDCCWLVVTGTWLVYLSIYWECHHPNWRTHIFQRGCFTTNQAGENPKDITISLVIRRDFSHVSAEALCTTARVRARVTYAS